MLSPVRVTSQLHTLRKDQDLNNTTAS